MLSGRMLAESFAPGNPKHTAKAYRKATRALRCKLYTKTHKRRILCSPALRALIMKSGVQAIKGGKS